MQFACGCCLDVTGKVRICAVWKVVPLVDEDTVTCQVLLLCCVTSIALKFQQWKMGVCPTACKLGVGQASQFVELRAGKMGSHPVVVVPFCLSGISMYSIVVFKPRTYFILSKTSQLMFFSCKRCSFVL